MRPRFLFQCVSYFEAYCTLLFMRCCMAPWSIVKFPFVYTWVIGYGPTYGSSYLFDFLLSNNTLSRILYVCGLRFLFSN